MGKLFTIFLLLSTASVSVEASQVKLLLGWTKNGTPTKTWIEAISTRNSERALEKISVTKKPLSKIGHKWLGEISKVRQNWSEIESRVEPAFPGIEPPSISIIVGNQGGPDAFTYEKDKILLDLSAWEAEYGKPSRQSLSDKPFRIVAHEYSHILMKIWLDIHPQVTNNDIQKAKFEMLYEGVGDYFSLSSKWVASDGVLTEYAEKKLKSMLPVVIENLSKLSGPPSEENRKILSTLSSGPFENKWGSLSTALLLAKLTNHNPSNLPKYIEKGNSLIDELFELNVKKTTRPPVEISKFFKHKIFNKFFINNQLTYWFLLLASAVLILLFLK